MDKASFGYAKFWGRRHRTPYSRIAAANTWSFVAVQKENWSFYEGVVALAPDQEDRPNAAGRGSS